MPAPVTNAQRYLLVAASVMLCVGWTYGSTTTKARAANLAWLPFPPKVIGWYLVATSVAAIIAAFQHRGIPLRYAWAATMLGPSMLAAIWTCSALIYTPWLETLYVFAALAVAALTAVVAVRWGRHRTVRLVPVIAAGLTAAGLITAAGDVSRWSAWSSAVVYIGFCAMIYLGAASSSPRRDS